MFIKSKQTVYMCIYLESIKKQFVYAVELTFPWTFKIVIVSRIVSIHFLIFPSLSKQIVTALKILGCLFVIVIVRFVGRMSTIIVIVAVLGIEIAAIALLVNSFLKIIYRYANGTTSAHVSLCALTYVYLCIFVVVMISFQLCIKFYIFW